VTLTEANGDILSPHCRCPSDLRQTLPLPIPLMTVKYVNFITPANGFLLELEKILLHAFDILPLLS